MMLAVLASLAGLLLLASLIPFYPGEAWWWRGFDFPRLQLFLAACGLLAVAALVLDMGEKASWWVAAMAFASLAIQGWWIVPYTKLSPVKVAGAEPDARRGISVLTANVYQPNRNWGDLVRLVREWQPDLLVALEANSDWQGALDALQDEYPHSMKCPLENLFGMLVYSKLPLENTKTQFLVEEGVPSMHALATLPSGDKVRIHFLHPAPPSPTENEESSERDAELLIVGKSVRRARAPVIVTGDLNDVAWSATTRLFLRVSGLLDPRVGRGMFCSYNAKRWFIRWPLDHLFCSSRFRLSRLALLPPFGSDHFAVFMELVLAGDGESGLAEPAADDEDRALAREKMADEDVDSSRVHNPEVSD